MLYMNKKYNTEIFIKKAKEIHGDRYNYSLVDYKKSNVKVKIICYIHGIFEQVIYKHITRKHGCPLCSEKKRHTVESFIEKAKQVHGENLYDYSMVEYKNAKIKIKIICPIHGIFEQSPSGHLSGKGCFKCKGSKISQSLFMSNDDFLKKAKIIHGDLYDYSCVNYKSAHKKIKIICKKHGVFKQSPNSHLNGRGCPECKKSNGEKKIKEFLENNNIKFQEQKTFKKCRNIYPLKFDFYLENHNLIIEFNGIQHFSEIKYYHKGKYNFDYQIKNDNIKRQYARDNNIKLLEIAYWDYENIESILKKELDL